MKAIASNMLPSNQACFPGQDAACTRCHKGCRQAQGQRDLARKNRPHPGLTDWDIGEMEQNSKKNRGIPDELGTEASVASVDRTQYLQI
ncbi:hypothetical protein OPT61_g5788 [Boeremia exigua]|uniref:Uncharacterized protein n=1 Tax=Boeremia exigua TaxID=749465 RepID=A0ACC2I948_9PLEO|nr:hypothetical protein OPT61_g5788 [Boeremia exigua]